MGIPIVHFADYLKMLPSAWVFEHFIQGDDISRKILSSSMIDDGVIKFTESEMLRSKFLSLNDTEQLTCALIYFTGDAGFKVAKFEGFENTLLRSFLVYARTNQNGEIRLFGFHEFRKTLMHQFVETIIKACGVSEPGEAVGVWEYLCVNDITLVTAMAAQKLLKKRKNGSLIRASSLQLKKTTDTFGVLKHETNDYVNSLMIAYCLENKLFVETETDYVLNSCALSSWFTQTVNERLKSIVDFTTVFTGGIWSGLLHELLERNVLLSADIFPLEMRGPIIDIMMGLKFAGQIGVRKHGTGIVFCKVIKTTSASESKAADVIILPDFSAVIAQESDPVELYQFSQTGSITSFDRVYKGKIEKEVLSDALSRGYEGTHIIEWLKRWNAPPNVVETVREWQREYYRLYITDRNMLVSADEKVSFQISSFEPLREFIEQVPAHALYMIKKGSEQKVREILGNLGFDYRMPGQDYEIEITQPSVEEVLPQAPEKWILFTETKNEEVDTQVMRGTKYGTELKTLDINETVHVIDYAVLTGQNLSIDYEGSPYIKDGIYSIKPLSCEKGIDPVLEAEVTRTRSRKRFYIKKIRKIGVISR